MRARNPDASGTIRRAGVDVYWERFGEGDPAVLFLNCDPIVDIRTWKAQIPYVSRRHRTVTFDPRGNGQSGRPTARERYADEEYIADSLAVLDAAGVEQAVVVGLCQAAGIALVIAAAHADRVLGVVAVNPGLALTSPHPHRAPGGFDTELDDDTGWNKENRRYWLRDWRGYCEFFFGELIPEPHSTKAREDCVEWSSGTTPGTMLAYRAQPAGRRHDELSAALVCRAIRCPVLVINGDRDMCQPPQRSHLVAELTGGDLVVLEGAGHLPNARDPVRVNLEIDAFLARIGP
jgi:pimeloyl-ACP methyl ester carboxylesterase